MFHAAQRLAAWMGLLGLFGAAGPQVALAAETPPRPNVLLICVDDLKPLLGCYGDQTVKSPSIDSLAQRGTRFDLAFCNQAVCSPSRNALLVGMRPSTLGIYDLGTNFRRARPEAVTLPQYFKQHGYRSEGLGKIFHVGHGNHEDDASWSVPHWRANVVAYALPESRAPEGLTREEALFSNQGGNVANLPRGAAWEAADVPDNAYPDGALAEEAIRRLQAAQTKPDEPFFLAVGFVKPHLPFCAPKKYWDMYDPAAFQLPARNTPPDGAPDFAPTSWGELRQYRDMPKEGPLAKEDALRLIHGYHAATSYMDAQVGRVLHALEETGLAKNTIVVLWGDHGWHLGDHGQWCKHTNYEQAARIPLVVATPGAQAGAVSRALVESVDVYPTLCELAGLPAPQDLDGASFAATLRDSAASIKEAILHVYPRGERIGRAVRTARHRLVEWKKPNAPAEEAVLELYDYEADPQETQNLAAAQPEVVTQLRTLLAKFPEAKPQLRPAPAAAKKKAQPKKKPKPNPNGGANKSDRPNIVIFLADDLSWSDCSIYGDAGIRTPNMERVANDGMTFTHAFVASPSCAPSRAALLTGLAPAVNGAMFNHTLPDKTHKRWPAWFQELGYEVAAIGKVAHYATVREYGFDHVSHFNYHQDECVDEAVKWLEQRKPGKPLCLFVGTNWPHVPWPEETSYAAESLTLPPTQVDTSETRHWRARYAEAVTYADRDLGLLYDAAQKFLDRNTLFLFTSDHGAQFPFGKWNCYDAGIRTPLIAVWPGKIRPDVRSDALVSWLDLLPTCLEAAGGGAPQLSGKSLLPVLRGETEEHHDRIFTTHSGDGQMNEYPMRSVRDRQWKYIRNLTPEAEHHTHVDKAQNADGQGYWRSWERQAAHDDAAAALVRRYHQRPAEELYFLSEDPWEQHNLAAEPKHAERLAAMRTELDAWMQAQGDEGLTTENARRPVVKALKKRAPLNRS